MRKEFIETESRYQAQKQCAWASKVTKVNCGFMCFESIADFENWKNQY